MRLKQLTFKQVLKIAKTHRYVQLRNRAGIPHYFNCKREVIALKNKKGSLEMNYKTCWISYKPITLHEYITFKERLARYLAQK